MVEKYYNKILLIIDETRLIVNCHTWLFFLFFWRNKKGEIGAPHKASG